MKLEGRKTCRICNSERLIDIISLGEQHIAAYTPKGSDPKPVLEKFPFYILYFTNRRNSYYIEPNPWGYIKNLSISDNIFYKRKANFKGK